MVNLLFFVPLMGYLPGNNPYPGLLYFFYISVRRVHTTPYPTKNFCNFCRTRLPVPGTSGSSVRRGHKDPGYVYGMIILGRNVWKFWKFFKTLIPLPGTSVSSVTLPYPYPKPRGVLLGPHTVTWNPQSLQNLSVKFRPITYRALYVLCLFSHVYCR